MQQVMPVLPNLSSTAVMSMIAVLAFAVMPSQLRTLTLLGADDGRGAAQRQTEASWWCRQA